MHHRALFASLILVGAALVPITARADEGMWPFNMVPKETIQQKYGFEVSDPFLDHAMKSSVRFNNGGSGSFVSKDGLVMTNHHVGADCIQKLSQGEQDLMKNGFVAQDHAAEQKCPALELNQLLKIDDVTAKVNAAAEGQKTEADQDKAKKAEMARIEKACADQTGHRCDVVTLYSGGAYHLYEYKRFTDVRLVFAPEAQAAFFGGDIDNFTYPRMCLDVAMFRVYEDDKPVDTSSHFMKFSKEGAQRGQLVFVSGNPGSTGRFSSTAELVHLRENYYPFLIDGFAKTRDAINRYMATSEAAERAGRGDIARLENAIKALTGYLGGLKDDALMAEAQRRQDDVKAKLQSLPEAEKNRLLEAWPKLEQAYATYGEIYRGYLVTNRYFRPAGNLVDVAQTLLRLSEELPKPSEARLREYRDSNLDSVDLHLYSPAPIDDGLEALKIELGINAMIEVFGADHPAIKAALAGQTPKARAEALVKETKLREVDVRKQLREGGKAAVDAANDPMIGFVKAWDGLAREYRKRYEDDVEAIIKAYSGRIAEAWAKAYGTSVYPDATFTPRLSYGVVQGYREDGEMRDWRTQIGDLYRRHKRKGGASPYELAPKWADAMGKVDFSVPFDFVSTNDIIGGNSGSPVFDGNGEVVGLIFDGNLQMLPNRFIYRDGQSRAISVHTQAIIHALTQVYEGEHIAAELGH